MKVKAGSLPLLSKLTKAMLVIAAFFGGSNAVAADRTFDETAQLNSFDLCVDAKFSNRRVVTGFTRNATEMRWADGTDLDGQPLAEMTLIDSVEILPAVPSQFMMPHTSFGVGSIALNALGYSASVAPFPAAVGAYTGNESIEWRSTR